MGWADEGMGRGEIEWADERVAGVGWADEGVAVSEFPKLSIAVRT